MIRFTGHRDKRPAGKMVRNIILYHPVKIEAGWHEKVMKEMKMLSPKRCESLIKKAIDDTSKRIEYIRIAPRNEQNSIMPKLSQLT